MTKKKEGSKAFSKDSMKIKGTEHTNERVKELEDRIIHIQADFDNYRKSLDKQKSENEKRASEMIISDLLEVIDDFMYAINNAGSEGEGLKRIYDKLISILAKHGLKPIEAKGKPFDHYYHDAVISEKSDNDEGTIIEEFQKGFMLNSRVIRHSKVKVAKK